MSEAILVALIASVLGPSLLAVIQARRTGRLEDRIGYPDGSLVAMVQSVIESQADQDQRLAVTEQRTTQLERQVGSLDRRLGDVERTVVNGLVTGND